MTCKRNSNVAKSPVVNASPLIFLASSDFLYFLQLLGEEIIVPKAVAVEIQARGPSDVTAQAIENTEWLTITETPPVPPEIQAWDLGPGESAVLSWAFHNPEGGCDGGCNRSHLCPNFKADRPGGICLGAHAAFTCS